jgi:hypothetical protein
VKRQNVHLYGEPSVSALDISSLTVYIKSVLPELRAEAMTAFVHCHLSILPPAEQEQRLEHLAMKFARAKVRNPSQHLQETTPLPGEVNYEKRRLSVTVHNAFGLLYDGFEVMHALAELIPREERGLNSLHIAFTNQLLGTWEEDDNRYHGRVGIFGYPCLLSTSGVVEAPARPREYYLLKQRYQTLGMNDATILGLDPHFTGRFLDYDDEALTEVIKGYVMQAIFYHFTGNPFCDDRDCRLYNAHWQEEVIRAQLRGSHEFCSFHEQALQRLRESLTKQDGLRSAAE